jgi:hypothetical protein
MIRAIYLREAHVLQMRTDEGPIGLRCRQPQQRLRDAISDCYCTHHQTFELGYLRIWRQRRIRNRARRLRDLLSD